VVIHAWQEKAYIKTHPYTLKELRNNIRDEILTVSRSELQRVNMFHRYQGVSKIFRTGAAIYTAVVVA
jgi:hypothetical protein